MNTIPRQHPLRRDRVSAEAPSVPANRRQQSTVSRLADAIRSTIAHLRHDGLAVACASVIRRALPWLSRPPRDPGEQAAERFLSLLGYRVLARNWRSPGSPRDEADLIVQTPDGREVVVVEVKRTASTWDALERVDVRKREVLWRIALSLEEIRDRQRLGGGEPCARALRHALRAADTIRIDLVAVRGDVRGFRPPARDPEPTTAGGSADARRLIGRALSASSARARTRPAAPPSR
jgi:Holliday junction resolvase-like predicted endonuclease